LNHHRLLLRLRLYHLQSLVLMDLPHRLLILNLHRRRHLNRQMKLNLRKIRQRQRRHLLQ
jgi:hypothetical protein